MEHKIKDTTWGTYSAGYEWRYGDKLKSVTSNFPGEAASVAYDYDGLGKRRSRTTGAGMTWWRWGLGWETLAEYTDPDTDGDIEGFSKFNVMLGMMHPLAEASVPAGQPPASATYSYLALDHLSSTRAVFSQAKAQTAAMEFFPYGGRLSTSGTLPHHQFTAKPYDTGTGQYYFPYRYYSPAMARWTAADPAGLVDGPNVYGYVGNVPTGTFDALGLWCVLVKPGRWKLTNSVKSPNLIERVIAFFNFPGYNRAFWGLYEFWSDYYEKRSTYYCCKKDECGVKVCGYDERIYKKHQFREKLIKYAKTVAICTGWNDCCASSPWTGREHCNNGIYTGNLPRR